MGSIFSEGNAEEQHEVVAAESGEVHVREIGRADLAAVDEVGQFHGGGEGQVFEVRRSGERCRRFAVDGLGSLGADGRAGGQGIEDEGGGDAVGDVQLADGVVTVALLVEAVEHGVLVFVGDHDAGEGGGLVDHLGCDFGELGFLSRGCVLGCGVCLGREGVERSGKEGGSEAEAAGDGEERAAVEHKRQDSEKRLARGD